jgi:hypothetical protein
MANFLFRRFPDLNFSATAVRNMITLVITEFQQDCEALQPLLEFDWLEYRQYLPVFCLMLDTVGDPVFEVIVEPFVDDVMFFSSDIDLCLIVIHIIRRASHEIRAQLFPRLVSASDDELSRGPVQKVICALIQESTHDQLEQLYLRIAQYLRTSLDCEKIVVALLSVGPVRSNLHFLIQNAKYLDMMKGKAFKTELYAIDGALKAYEAFHKGHGAD